MSCSMCGCDCASTAPALLTMGLHVRPQAKERARKGKAGNFYTPQATANFQDRAGWEMRAAGVRPLTQDGLRLDANFHLESMKPTKRADFDNYVKSLCDAGNRIAWEDDRQFTEAHIWLKPAINTDPFITFSVRPGQPWEAQ